MRTLSPSAAKLRLLKRLRCTLRYEKRAWASGASMVAGVDEVGRGAVGEIQASLGGDPRLERAMLPRASGERHARERGLAEHRRDNEGDEPGDRRPAPAEARGERGDRASKRRSGGHVTVLGG